MDNGFRLELLNGLNLGAPVDYYKNIEKKVTIYNSFIEKNKEELSNYEKTAFKKYLAKINKNLLIEILSRHIKEQIYKNYTPLLGISISDAKRKYNEVCNENLDFIKKKYSNKEYIGERNIGLIDVKVLKELNIDYLKSNKYLTDSILAKYNLPPNTMVPIDGRELYEYFGLTYFYNILYHNDNSFYELSAYANDAIKNGYLHPREYASLKTIKLSNKNVRINKQKMKLDDFYKDLKAVDEINRMREKYLLPSYEIDYAKYKIASKYNLKLNFGFFNGTK